MKNYLKMILILFWSVAICLYFSQPLAAGDSRAGIPVLLYHRVGYTAGPLTVTPDRLNHDLAELQQNGYETISLNSFADYLAGKDTPLPAKPILITFDDAYRDNYDNAFPILQQYHDIATFFIITGLVDNNPDRLTSSQILEMYAKGMIFGSHTVTHTPLGQEADERMKNELLLSKQFLEDLLGKPITAIAYPEGSYNTTTIRLATEVGYTVGFTVKRGVCHRQDPPFIVPRIAVFRFSGDLLGACPELYHLHLL
jgi:peptidoglycan/xylan/chitin deacetylase (PgdA/CDA1 family)